MPASRDGWNALRAYLEPTDSDDAEAQLTGTPGAVGSARGLLKAKPRLVACSDCQRPIIQDALPQHKLQCAQIRSRQAAVKLANGSAGTPRKRAISVSDDDFTPWKASVKPTSKTDADRQRAKKQRTDSVGGSAVKPASRPTAVPAPVRPAPPSNLNRICGVLTPDGSPCARSLTCTTHSMRDKRAVQGRTATYDVLLAEWQARKPPPAVAVAAPPMVKKPSAELALKAVAPKRAAAQQLHFGEVEDGSQREDEVDSEDEVEAVLAGVRASLTRRRVIEDPPPGSVALAVRNAHVARFSASLSAGFSSARPS